MDYIAISHRMISSSIYKAIAGLRVYRGCLMKPIPKGAIIGLFAFFRTHLTLIQISTFNLQDIRVDCVILIQGFHWLIFIYGDACWAYIWLQTYHITAGILLLDSQREIAQDRLPTCTIQHTCSGGDFSTWGNMTCRPHLSMLMWHLHLHWRSTLFGHLRHACTSSCHVDIYLIFYYYVL